MSEIISSPQKVEIKPVSPEFVNEDPRVTRTVLGEPIKFGDTIYPDRQRYPNWKLTLFTFPQNPQKDGCLFFIGPNTATPIGLVGKTPQQEKEQAPPIFAERIVEGSGVLLIQTSEGVIQEIEVSRRNPEIYKYGEGTRVAYIAGEKGIVGVNIGNPRDIPETPLEPGSPEASKEFWNQYDDLIKNSSSHKSE